MAAELPSSNLQVESRPSSSHRLIAGFGAVFVLAATLAAVMGNPAAGLEDGVSLCPARFPLTRDGSTLEIPYCSSHSLSAPNEEIQRLVVVIQGASRNAEGYLESVVEAAESAGVEDQTLIVAPQFLIDDDLAENPMPAALYWSSSGWKIGDRSLSSSYRRPWSMSSFSVVDTLIARLSNGDLFPNLTDIVVAGHSAGGQFVNRYAAGTSIDAQARRFGKHVRFVVANPSSYLYLSDRRPRPGRVDSFRRLTESERRRCRNYNRYKYGLTYLNDYMSLTGASGLTQRYASQEVIYLLGEEDTDRSDPLLDTTCAAKWQGPDRLSRGIAYHNYLGHLFGPAIHDRHRLSVVPGAGHDSGEMFDSTQGRSSLFDDTASDAGATGVAIQSRPRVSRGRARGSSSWARTAAGRPSSFVSTLRLVATRDADRGRR